MNRRRESIFETLVRSRAREGSISVWFALLLAVMVSLVLAEITSAKVSADRAQAANVMDQCMDSLFAHYDRESAELYGLYWLYTGSGGSPDPSGCISFLQDAAEELFSAGALRKAAFGSPLLNLKAERTALTGYTLATDASGAVFREMAAEAASDTAASGILTEVSRMISGGSREKAGNSYLEKSEGASYSEIQALSKSAKEATASNEEEADQSSAGNSPEKGVEVPADFVNPLPVLEKIGGKSLLELVLPEGTQLSQKKVRADTLVSGRSLHSGIGTIRAVESGSSTAFRAWVYTRFSDFTEPSGYAGLSYQMEYILCGKKSDRENLRGIVKKLLLLREAVNIFCLYTDRRMSAELQSTSYLIASALLIPEAAELVRLVLAASWAYAESVVDVKALLEGKRVAAVKTQSTWQTDLESLAKSGGNLSGLTRNVEPGIGYKEYLGSFLMTAGIRQITMRSMDMVESELRGRGRPEFRLDTCITAVTAEMNVRAENLITFEVEREQNYLEIGEHA